MDLFLEWGNDLVLTPSGSVATAVGWDEVRERIIRRILTNPAQTLPDGSSTQADYIFDPNYGIGGGALVSQNPTKRFVADLKKRIRAGVLADVAVSPSAEPQILIQQPQPNTITVYVGVLLSSGQTGVFSLSTSSTAASTSQTPSSPGEFILDQSTLDGPDVLG